MADLNVQPKKRGSILPWLLLLIGIIVLVYFLMRNNDNGSDTTGNAVTSDSVNRLNNDTSATDSVYGTMGDTAEVR